MVKVNCFDGYLDFFQNKQYTWNECNKPTFKIFIGVLLCSCSFWIVCGLIRITFIYEAVIPMLNIVSTLQIL